MARRSKADPGRVILAADAGSYSVASVNLAAAMAASSGGLLQGLFVEDEDLLQVTGLPCAREITLTTATERRTSTKQMRQSLRLVARQFRQTLQQEAQALELSWSFDTMRGRVRDLGLKPAPDAICTILAHAVTHRMHSARNHAARRILLLGKASSAQKRVLETLIGRFSLADVELTVGADGDDADRVETLRWVRRHSHPVRLVELTSQQLLASFGHDGQVYDYAILSGGRNDEETALLLKSLRCPVILVA